MPKTVTVNRSCVILSGVFKDMCGLVVGYDSIEDEVTIKVDEDGSSYVLTSLDNITQELAVKPVVFREEVIRLANDIVACRSPFPIIKEPTFLLDLTHDVWDRLNQLTKSDIV